jgi:hypothetical protein
MDQTHTTKHTMEAELQALKLLRDQHGERGTALFQACNAELFPCDALAFSVLERSLHLLKGFHLLLENGGYTCGAALLRMQLDNVLRFNGVALSKDPHDVAKAILNGTPLDKIKDTTGQPMKDNRLIELLSPKNPWVKHVYTVASGYIHLSDQHFHHFCMRSKENETGKRDIAIGDDEDYLSDEYKLQLVKAFAIVTRGILEMVRQWTEVREQHGSNQTLKQ